MTQAVELLLAGDDEEAVLAEWRALDTAGLASQAQHHAPSNRPHVTVVAVPSIDAMQEALVERLLVDRLPLTAWLGPLVVLGREPVVLARLVVATSALLALHREVADAAAAPNGGPSAPGRWLPHVTLAHRMPRSQVGHALEVLTAGERDVQLHEARRWDSERRVERPIC
jgi:hypothetical protein